jgi:hypothetical protein
MRITHKFLVSADVIYIRKYDHITHLKNSHYEDHLQVQNDILHEQLHLFNTHLGLLHYKFIPYLKEKMKIGSLLFLLDAW